MSRPIKLSHRFEYLAIQCVVQTIGNLPMGAATAVGASAARVVGMNSPLRKRAEQNLSYAMPELDPDARAEILREMFDGLTRSMVELRFLPRLLAEPDRFEVLGGEHLEAARAAGKGAVLASGHFGSWDAVRLAFAQQEWAPALIYRAFNNRPFDALAQKFLSAVPAPIFHKGKRGALGMLRHVKGGGAALILTDQRFTGAPKVPFFGHPAQTSLGAAEIALNHGAALLPVRGERIGRSSRFQVVIEPAIKPNGRSALELTAELNARLEAWIRKRPEQYFWMHNRWGKAALRDAAQ